MKKNWWILTCVLTVVLVCVVIVSALHFAQTANSRHHPPALTIERTDPEISPIFHSDEAQTTPDFSELHQKLAYQATDPRLGSFSGEVRDVHSGQVVWSHNPATPRRPASTTKLLTTTAALYTNELDDRLETKIVTGKDPGTIIVKAAGDVSISAEQLDAAAAELSGRPIEHVLVDTSIWPGESFPPVWNPQDVDAGYIAPMEPIMIEGGRIGGKRGDLPRSHTPASDVATALATRVGASQAGIASQADIPDTEDVLSIITSDTLEHRLTRMMEDSDNVLAEAIGRDLAVQHGTPTDAASRSELTLNILSDHGFNTTEVSIVDNSGLSEANLIPAQLLDEIPYRASTEEQLRPLLSTLPIAHATGTLSDRYAGLSGAGWIRAKTGTLTNTVTLAGVATAQSDRMFSFALVANDAPFQESRQAMDEMTSTLRDF